MKDMTKGPAIGHLCSYAIPLLLGNWFQMGYNAVDSIIVGRFIGKDALAAIGIAAPLMNLTILSISGLCIGAGVLMSEFFGAGKLKELRAQFSTTILSGAMLSIVISLLGILFITPILKALSVPAEILSTTTTYVTITFLGTPFTFLYNALSAALKSVGDSKTPLKFLMFASILNGVLDVIFIGLLDFGIICSATTTVIAEAVSALLALRHLTKNIPELCPKKEEWGINKEYLKKTLQFGGVSALQQSVQPIGKILIQSQVNALGVNVIAAFNAVSRIDALALVPGQSIGQAVTTYIAQNRGAGKKERIAKGYLTGVGLEIVYWLFFGTLVFFFKQPVMSLFVTGEEAAAVTKIGADYLTLMSLFYLLPAMTNCVQGFFRGMGKLKITLWATFTQTGIRVFATCLLAPSMGIRGIAFACAAGWIVMLLWEIPLCIKEILSGRKFRQAV